MHGDVVGMGRNVMEMGCGWEMKRNVMGWGWGGK